MARCSSVLINLLSFGSVFANTGSFFLVVFNAVSTGELLIDELLSSLASATLVFVSVAFNCDSAGCLAFVAGLVGCCKCRRSGMSSAGALVSSTVTPDACVWRLSDLGTGPSGNGVTGVCWGCSGALCAHSGSVGHGIAPLILVGCCCSWFRTLCASSLLSGWAESACWLLHVRSRRQVGFWLLSRLHSCCFIGSSSYFCSRGGSGAWRRSAAWFRCRAGHHRCFNCLRAILVTARCLYLGHRAVFVVGVQVRRRNCFLSQVCGDFLGHLLQEVRRVVVAEQEGAVRH
ncbi:hypothetical protein PF006_g29388 [Phytophthora fragariae]|uniref:Uncharacterized protein n=1 Tax=Phytophthora fragariae TaxID=53985 RepID=A0A6A3Q777_9STRA|nr:hypothetical protein PF006_g29388 [Phytophthora fragariae]